MTVRSENSSDETVATYPPDLWKGQLDVPAGESRVNVEAFMWLEHGL